MSLRTAEAQLAGRARLPEWHLRRLVSWLQGRIAEQQALLSELGAELERKERERAMRPANVGYVNGLQKWRRERTALKVSRDG